MPKEQKLLLHGPKHGHFYVFRTSILIHGLSTPVCAALGTAVLCPGREQISVSLPSADCLYVEGVVGCGSQGFLKHFSGGLLGCSHWWGLSDWQRLNR